jgi:hypothetical protein
LTDYLKREKSAQFMALATFRIAFENSPVDAEKGIISGCILAEANKLATFSGPDGKPIEVMVTPALIDSLLNLANSQARLDAYWTHDRLNPENADKDPIHDSVGVWQNFRTNEKGDLIADAALEPSAYREKILWKAQNDKRGIMTSLVFNYRGGRNDAVATEIISGDFVRFGAATTALLSQHKPNNNNMTKEEIENIVSAKFSALSKEMEAKMAEVEIEVGEEDKVGETEEMPAVMKTFRRLANSSKRQTAALSAKLSAVEKENAELKAQISNAGDVALAKFTSTLGKGQFQVQATKTAENDPETAILSAIKTLPAGQNTRAHAKAHLARTNPELYAKL